MIKLKIDSKPYYKNKLKFKKLYKELGMVWMENTKIGDVWAVPDKMDKVGYIRKIPEEGNFKRFIIHDCPQMVEFLKGIGAVEIADEPFEDVVVKEPEPFHHEDYSGHMGFRELLESMPDNFGVIWGSSLTSSSMSEEFKKRWKELQVKYARYKAEDFYAEIEVKNKRREKEVERSVVEEVKNTVNVVSSKELNNVKVGEPIKRRVFRIKRKVVS